MTMPELYRQLFNAPGGKDVLADIAGWIQRTSRGDEKPSAGELLAHIVYMLNKPDVPVNGKRRVQRASGGRIAHG